MSHFRVSPAVLGPLGAEQLQDPALAVLELIKNSWDADATRVATVIDQRKSPGSISVVDNGHGMDRNDFENNWLVIGHSAKRDLAKSDGDRPLIGEKGLGRLASLALGRSISVRSSRTPGGGFTAAVDWERLRSEKSLEDYAIPISPASVRRGTRIQILDLRRPWTAEHTSFLATHAEFLASVPGEIFRISLSVDGIAHPMEDSISVISRLAEATFEMNVLPDGTPRVVSCIVSGTDETGIVFREMKPSEKDPRLSGTRVSLQFLLRDEAQRQLGTVLERNEAREVLERYQGVRVFRDGINVPPYGLNTDDWAGLEKQRTSTGGPTMVPGNSQLVGEVHIARAKHAHLVVTAGRAGFSDQSAVGSLAQYVRWSARELATARRAKQLGITDSTTPVPSRVDIGSARGSVTPERAARNAILGVSRSLAARKDPQLRKDLEEVSAVVTGVLDKNEETLRLYAQLASSGIAATSFAHELRAEFDVVSMGLKKLRAGKTTPSEELLELLNDSWTRIRAFGALFKVVPVRLRRKRALTDSGVIASSLETILGLAPPDKIDTSIGVPDELRLLVVPAELDSIFLNLVSNAVKAIAESDNREHGRIRVTLQRQGQDVEIAVSDNGSGVSAKVAAIMFEPLEGRFSEGTGMGLPIVKFIAERYKGAVRLSPPPPDYSTTFVVALRKVVET